MTTDQILEGIKVMTEVFKANNGWWGDPYLRDDAKQKIAELIKMMPKEQNGDNKGSFGFTA